MNTPIAPSPAAQQCANQLDAGLDAMARALAAEYYTQPTEHDILVVRAIYTRGLLDGAGLQQLVR